MIRGAPVASLQPALRGLSHCDKRPRTGTVARVNPEWSRAQHGEQRRAWDQVLRPVASELTARAHEMSVEVTQAIGEQLPDLLSNPEAFEANRASTEASILGFAQILEQGADPAATSLGAATLAYTQESAHRGIPLTTLIRSYRLGHAAAWEGVTALIAAHADDLDQRATVTELCSAWLFAYVDAALCLAEDFYSAERERWARSTAATRAETIATILAGEPIDAALASRRLGYELDRRHIAVVAWLQAHEEGRDTHAAMEAAIGAVRDGLNSVGSLVHPRGILSIAAWIGTHDAVPSRQLDDLRFDTRAATGVRVAIGEPGQGIAGFRQSHNEAMHARRVAELGARPPGTITRYSRVALAAIASADVGQAHTFVQRELQGLAGEDDLSTRLTATLRTYLDEHASRSRTAKRLGIHENTVSYRIKQAEEMLGRSVDQRTLELRVALALAPLVRDHTG